MVVSAHVLRRKGRTTLGNEITENLGAEPACNRSKDKEQVSLDHDGITEDHAKPPVDPPAPIPVIPKHTGVFFEFLFWIFLSLTPLFYTFFTAYLNTVLNLIPNPGIYLFRATVPSLFYSIMILIIPFLSKQIFGEYPLLALRHKYFLDGEASSTIQPGASTASSMEAA
jgi:hypothetical protein